MERTKKTLAVLMAGSSFRGYIAPAALDGDCETFL